MPKCAMTFNLPEERNEMLIAQRGIDFYCVIVEIQKIIREHHRYGKKTRIKPGMTARRQRLPGELGRIFPAILKLK